MGYGKQVITLDDGANESLMAVNVQLVRAENAKEWQDSFAGVRNRNSK